VPPGAVDRLVVGCGTPTPLAPGPGPGRRGLSTARSSWVRATSTGTVARPCAPPCRGSA